MRRWLQFSDRQRQISDRGHVVGAQNVNFARNFTANRGIYNPKFYILKKIVMQKKFYDRLKFREGAKRGCLSAFCDDANACRIADI